MLLKYLAVSCVLFVIGIFGVLTRRSFIVILLSVEIMLNAANLSLVAFSSFLGNPAGQTASLFVIAIAASEVAIGLALAVLLFRKMGTTDTDVLNLLKW